MEQELQRILVENLLERLDADAKSDAPRITSYISSSERNAIRSLLNALQPFAKPSVKTVDTVVEAQTPTIAPIPPVKSCIPEEVRLNSEPVDIALVLDAIGSTSDQGMVLCLDFGTAKSKAFAGSIEDDEDPEPLMIELGLGKRDADPDGAVYSVNSSIWISDDGLLFAGANALSKSALALSNGGARRRLDSIKQELSQSNSEQDLAHRLLEKDINPTAQPLSYEDALCFFLAYLTDLAGKELKDHGYSRYMKRRFTLPAWQPAQRGWASRILSECLKRAQLLADTFSSRWSEGIPVAEFKAAVCSSQQYSEQLDYLLDCAMPAAGGLLEPLAAGSSRIWSDRNARNFMFVLDIGAGTTDFSAFWFVQNIENGFRRAFSVYPSSDAIRMAGDLVDDILVKSILEQVHGQPNEATRKRIESGLRPGIRRLKEQLFNRGQIDVTLVTDQTVRISREEFEASAPIGRLTQEFRSAIQTFLEKVDKSWGKAIESPLMVLTGGSARLPFISALAEEKWTIGGKSFTFSKAPTVPDQISHSFDEDFQREYPQLAVAVGGVLPILDEKNVLKEWLGSASAPGPLEKYSITGA